MPLRPAALARAVLVLFGAGHAHAAEIKALHPGEKIYREMCAECHGKQGEGVADKHDEVLTGNRSLASLTKYIAKSMPEDKEGTCVGKDAENVAAYIFDAFYSPAAQARINPVRESLSRLTVAQYRNSAADLVGRFQGGFDRPAGKEHGLTARYSGKKPLPFGPQLPREKNTQKREAKERKDRTSFTRRDERVAFNFGTESPDPEKLRGDEFSNRWDGSIYAPETGTYEFILKTENGVRLWVNNPEDPLIDAWVSHGPNVREEKKSIFLLGGRSYPIAIEHFKFREKTASVEFLWKPPQGRQELVPMDVLEPQGRPPTMVVTTAFPADDRSDGYERGTTISKEWDQAATRAALEVMTHVIGNIDGLARTKAGAPDRAAKLKDFARQFVEAAFRHPLDEEQRKIFIEHQFEKAPTPDVAIKRVVLLALKSPRFLYPSLAQSGTQDDFSIASRLALTLWDSIPDAQLTRAASEGRLKTREQIATAARRMVADPRAKTKLHGFFHQWLELDRAEMASKDPKAFPGFDAMFADLRESLWLFLDDVVWSDASDYRQLITADYLWLNERLAKYYGRQVRGEEFQRVSFDPAQRSGVITHPYLLASLAYSRATSPIHRGVFLSRNIVGLALKNPPVAVAFEDAKFDPTLTMREKVSQLTKDTSCVGCHSVINPLGFSLEHFDAVGRWRMKDNNKPVDAIGEFETDDGHRVKLTGPRDIANYTVTSPSAHRAFVRQLFNHMVKQPAPAFGTNTLADLRTRFEANGFNIQRLMADIAVTAALHDRTATMQKVADNSPAPQ